MAHCFYCGVKLHAAEFAPPGIKRTIDHQVPKCRGGKSEGRSGIKNLVWSCEKCNQDKGQLTLEEYRAVIAYRNGFLKIFDFTQVPFYGEGEEGQKTTRYYNPPVTEEIVSSRAKQKDIKSIATLGEIVRIKK